MTEAVTPPAKKRRWRKPPTPVTDNNNKQECNKTTINSHFTDFLHPETLSDVDLICRLNEYHVPVNSNCSRDELVELFSKHVMPKPQRTRKRRGQLQVNNNTTRLPRTQVIEDSMATALYNDGSLATTPCNNNNNLISEDRVITKRKQSSDPTPPHRKKAFIRNDITWP